MVYLIKDDFFFLFCIIFKIHHCFGSCGVEKIMKKRKKGDSATFIFDFLSQGDSTTTDIF